jgi:SAM-dependent methyltransferase
MLDSTNHQSPHRSPGGDVAGTARAYDCAGRNYATYADGESGSLFDFTGRYGFADRQIWQRLDATQRDLASKGRRSLSILDVGCGPGTWLYRVITRSVALGFTDIKAEGIDLSPAMIALARASRYARPGSARVRTVWQVADVCDGLQQADRSVDLCLCLYGVFNHLPTAELARIASELARVTAGHLFLTVRAAGSLPTIYVDAVDHASRFHQDNDTDRMEVDLLDGRHLSFPSHLFRSAELRALFAPLMPRIGLCGLDVFHSRFATDPRWNPAYLDHDPHFAAQLDRLERSCAADPDFVNRASHILLVGRSS